jgi:bifunctional enzyme CysN/CysC
MNHRQARIVITGHLDHGKSTLLGQLLCQCNALPDERLEEVFAASMAAGKSLDPSMVLDQLSEERDNAMTIDTTQAYLEIGNTGVTIIDTTGHQELVGNMLSGTGMADAAILVVDVASGIEAQTHLHLSILSLLNVDQILVVINKMDLVSYAKESFEELRGEMYRLLHSRQMAPIYILPVSAIDGENLIEPSAQMKWYKGPHLLDALVAICPTTPLSGGPMCFPIQHVLDSSEGPVYLGRLESGTLDSGQTITVLPRGEIGKIASIQKHQGTQESVAGDCLGLMLKGISKLRRGQVLCNIPPWPSPLTEIGFKMIWLSKKPLHAGCKLAIYAGPQNSPGVARYVGRTTVKPSDGKQEGVLRQYDLGTVNMQLERSLVFDLTGRIRFLNRVVFCDGPLICAVGHAKAI